MNEMKTFSIPIRNVQFESANNEQFLKAKFFAISEGDNLNQSNFEIDGMIKCIETRDYANKPILGAWSKDKITNHGVGDFDGHNSDLNIDSMSGEMYNTYLGENSERPLGLILPGTAKIEEYKGKKWISFEGCIWAKYNKEAVALLRKKRTNNVSVEIEVLSSYEDERGVEIIQDFTLLGITVIGVDPGIKNANLVLDFTLTPQYTEFVKVFSKELSGIKKDESKADLEFLEKDKFGTGPELLVDISEKSASDDEWGNVDKTKLRNDILLSKNYKDIVRKAYLVVEEGWEVAPSEKLKYPVVQIKDNKVVLNRNGIEAAGAYLMKEKDRDYFKAAKAKLNRIRQILGMKKLMDCEFGIESNEGWGEVVKQNQPEIIKMKEGKDTMEKKEVLEELTDLFAEKEKLEKEKSEMEASYEDKLGEFELSEENEKAEKQKEMQEIKAKMDKNDADIREKELSIMKLSQDLTKMDDDEDISKYDDVGEKYPTIDEEEEEYPIDTVGHNKYQSILPEGCNYISNSKSFIVCEKGEEVCAFKYEIVDGEIKLSDEMKCSKVYAKFITGGELTETDELPLPAVMVEITKGFVKQFKNNQVCEKALSEAKDDLSKYKEEVKSLFDVFDDITKNIQVSKELRDEVNAKIFNREFSSSENFEMFVKAKLFDLAATKPLSGSFASASEKNSQPESLNDKAQQILKKYK